MLQYLDCMNLSPLFCILEQSNHDNTVDKRICWLFCSPFSLSSFFPWLTRVIIYAHLAVFIKGISKWERYSRLSPNPPIYNTAEQIWILEYKALINWLVWWWRKWWLVQRHRVFSDEPCVNGFIPSWCRVRVQTGSKLTATGQLPWKEYVVIQSNNKFCVVVIPGEVRQVHPGYRIWNAKASESTLIWLNNKHTDAARGLPVQHPKPLKTYHWTG